MTTTTTLFYSIIFALLLSQCLLVIATDVDRSKFPWQWGDPTRTIDSILEEMKEWIPSKYLERCELLLRGSGDPQGKSSVPSNMIFSQARRSCENTVWWMCTRSTIRTRCKHTFESVSHHHQSLQFSPAHALMNCPMFCAPCHKYWPLSVVWPAKAAKVSWLCKEPTKHHQNHHSTQTAFCLKHTLSLFSAAPSKHRDNALPSPAHRPTKKCSFTIISSLAIPKALTSTWEDINHFIYPTPHSSIFV